MGRDLKIISILLPLLWSCSQVSHQEEDLYVLLNRYQQEQFRLKIQNAISIWGRQLNKSKNKDDSTAYIKTKNLWTIYLSMDSVLESGTIFKRRGSGNMDNLQLSDSSMKKVWNYVQHLSPELGQPVFVNALDFMKKDLLIDKLELKEYYLEAFRQTIYSHRMCVPPSTFFYVDENKIIHQVTVLGAIPK